MTVYAEDVRIIDQMIATLKQEKLLIETIFESKKNKDGKIDQQVAQIRLVDKIRTSRSIPLKRNF